jgi:hypothetical protein
VPIPRIINLNDTTPGPPVGRSNVKWQGDDQDPRNVSAYVLLGGVNAQTGTSYAFVEDDEGRLVAFSNAAAVAVGLASAVALPNGFWTIAANYGAGTVTITPDVSTINGAASLDLAQNQWAIIFSDGVNYSAVISSGTIKSTAGITIDGGGSVPTTGSKGYVQIPFAATIVAWTLLADASGNAQITVKKCAYSGFPTTSSIVASAPPKLTSQQKNTDATLTGWTTAIAASDILEFVLDSASTVKRLNLILELQRS